MSESRITNHESPGFTVRQLGLQPYEPTYSQMREFTLARDEGSADELWFLQHPRVFTQGQAGKAEHVLAPGDIPVVQSNRGGQVTYHGPGQIVVYILLDLHRRGYGIRQLVTRLENAIVATLAEYGIASSNKPDAPGVYVGSGAKIASLGLRVTQGRTYHGIALNVDMDLEPFSRINPCGYQGLQVTQVKSEGGPADLAAVGRALEQQLLKHLA